MRFILIVITFFVVGCSSTSALKQEPMHVIEHEMLRKEAEVVTIEKAVIPQVWSDHKILNISEEICAQKGVDILTTLGFEHIVMSGSYVYGNYINNRAAIKCTRVENKTFVYAVVAGPKIKIVERLRNEIIWKL
ncbi:MAG: hypothetical protein KBT75_08840 [Oleispira antarctica]|nr:hypothetical protein [Oleispira antarctica]MBQ0793062.1 hypothetical protein [Oleispira antarctica]